VEDIKMKTLLIAEDEPILRMLIMDTLEDEGYALEEAADGEEALEKIKEIDFDLVILDYMMPKMTGIEVIEKARQLERRQQSKILMLSAKSQQAEQDKVIQAGADGFMSKPFSPLELIDKVEEMLRG
jgi:CheY-like chemotaxis protein